MAKRYLGGGISFEQKDVYQEFSEDEGGGGDSTTLSGLTDVDITNPTDGQTLVYNAATGKWENGAAGGGGGLIVHVSKDEQTFVYTLDKTWQEIADAMLLGVVQLIEVDSDGASSYQIDSVSIIADKYCVDFSNSYSGKQYSADSANGYPYYQPD